MRHRSALTPSRITVAAVAAVIGASSRKRRSLSATIFWMSSSDILETSVPIEAMRARACAISVASITSDPVPLWILRELDRIEVPIWPGHDDRAFNMGCVHPQIGDERFSESLLCGA